MQRVRRYNHSYAKRETISLTNNERESISRGLAQNQSIREIVKWIIRYPSTITREISRNRGKSSCRAFSASQRARRAATSRKMGKSILAKQDRLRSYVIDKLRAEWSPREISERIRIEYPKDIAMAISYEAIYQYIYILPRGELKKMLIKALRQEHKYSRVQKGGQAGRQIGAKSPT